MNQKMKKIFTYVERPQLTTIALKKGLLVADDSVALFQDIHFMDRYLKYEQGMKAVMVSPWKEVY